MSWPLPTGTKSCRATVFRCAAAVDPAVAAMQASVEPQNAKSHGSQAPFQKHEKPHHFAYAGMCTVHVPVFALHTVLAGAAVTGLACVATVQSPGGQRTRKKKTEVSHRRSQNSHPRSPESRMLRAVAGRLASLIIIAAMPWPRGVRHRKMLELTNDSKTPFIRRPALRQHPEFSQVLLSLLRKKVSR
jgi:hypothetical protein